MWLPVGPWADGAHPIRADGIHASKKTAPHDHSLTWSARTRPLLRRLLRSEPVAALERHVQEDAHREHQPGRERVAQRPGKLGHVFEIHPVDGTDKGGGEEDGGLVCNRSGEGVLARKWSFWQSGPSWRPDTICSLPQTSSHA
jgi:hypothetical protein